jgi:hypothetical protein
MVAVAFLGDPLAALAAAVVLWLVVGALVALALGRVLTATRGRDEAATSDLDARREVESSLAELSTPRLGSTRAASKHAEATPTAVERQR